MTAGASALPVWVAACMEPEEWEAWRDTNERMQGKGKAFRPCSDCTLGFAAEMRAIGRCNGTPAGAEHDEIQEEQAMEPQAIPTTINRRLEVAGELPCATCVHAVVCGLRPALEALRSIQVALPRLDAALGLQLTATATCSHHERAPKPRKASPTTDGERKQGGRTWTPEQREAQAERMRGNRRGRPVEDVKVPV